MDNVKQHKDICDKLNRLYEQKNKAYGNSFHDSYKDYGLVMAAIRLGDKYNRFKTMVKDRGIPSHDESIKDTLIDLANYAIMTVMEMENDGVIDLPKSELFQKQQNECDWVKENGYQLNLNRYWPEKGTTTNG